MTSAHEPHAAEYRRLHPMTPVIRILGYAWQLLFALILLLLFSRGNTWELYAALFGIPLAIYETIRYFTLTYALTDEQLIVRQGVLIRSERHIPFERIQNIDSVQPLVQRILGVVEVRVETASGAEPEAVLRVVAAREADRLRSWIDSARNNTRADQASEESSPASDDEEVLLHLPWVELAKVGILTYRGLAVVGIVLGFAWQFDLYDHLSQQWHALEDLLTPRGGGRILAWLLIALLGFILVTLFSLLWSVVKLYDYRLVLRGDDLRVTCGLLTRLTATIPRKRIQLISVQESILHRLFDRVTVRVETAGGGGDDDKIPISRRWLVPLVARHQVPSLLRRIQPDITSWESEWHAVHPKATRRIAKKCVLVGGLLSAALIAWSTWVGIVLCPLILVGLIWYARAMSRSYRYAYDSRGIAFRSGVFTRRTSATRFDRVQVVDWNQSPFDRRYQMASIQVDTAGSGPAGHRIKIPYLSRIDADQLYEEIVERTQATEFQWQ